MNGDVGSEAWSANATSRSLLERIKANDQSAWARLVTLYSPLVLDWCRRAGLRDQDAADVFQEVFQAVASHIIWFRKENRVDTFRGWLRVITRNKIRDHFRKRDGEAQALGGSEARLWFGDIAAPELLSEESAAEKTAEQNLFRRSLDHIRMEFEERTWQAFWRTAVEGGMSSQVAVELAMTPGAVRVAKSRVLQRLREELGDMGP